MRFDTLSWHSLCVLCALLGPLLLASITPRVEALYPYTLIHNASHDIALTPDEWSSEFKCRLTNVKEAEQNGTLPLECYRDEYTWLFKHVDEIHDQFKLLVKQDSLDERFADKVYAVNGHTGVSYHHYKFNSGDPARDKQLERDAAGPQVDNRRCKQHLQQMVALLVDLSALVDEKRKATTDSPSSAAAPARQLEEKHFRLARVLDSFGRYESGQLAGRYHSFGMHRECTSTPLLLGDDAQASQDSKTSLVGSRYCWARLNLDGLVTKQLRGRGPYNATWGDFAFHLATCLPATCHSQSFSDNQENLALLQILIDSQYQMPSSMYVNHSQPVDSVYCLVDSDSKLARMPLGGKLFVAALLGWLSLCAYATRRRRDKHNILENGGGGGGAASGVHQRQRRSFWSHVDLIESYYDFVGRAGPGGAGGRAGSDINLDPLNFVRCFLTFLVLLAHSAIVFGPVTVAQLSMQAQMETGRMESLAQFGFVLVDTFFVITGLVITYLSLRHYARRERAQKLALASHSLPATVTSKKMTLVDFEHDYSPRSANFYALWLAMTANRYLRLVPLYFLAFWFKKGLFVWLGSGPMWDYGTNGDSLMGGCLQRESWLTPFTPLSAYSPLTQQCLPQTWSISNDLFFWFFAPAIVILLFKRPLLAYLCSLLALTLGLYFGFTTYYSLDARLRFDFERMRNHAVLVIFQRFSQAYSVPSYRVPAILCGIVAGHVLYMRERKRTSEDYQRGPGRLTLAESAGAQGGQVRKRSEARPYWPWWLRWILTPTAFLFMIYNLFSSFYLPEIRKSLAGQANRWLPLYLACVHHSVWSISNGIVFLRLVSDWRNSSTARLFASRFFKITSKLSYAFLLVHWDILSYDVSIETQPSEFSRWNYSKNLAMCYFYGIILTVPIHIILENPINKLIKTYVLRT